VRVKASVGFGAVAVLDQKRKGIGPTIDFQSDDYAAATRKLDLEASVFSKDDPKAIAASLKRSAERSRRRKSEPYRSAMSMLTFYVNRAGKTLPAKRKRVLERAKDELRKAFGRD